MSSYLNTLYVTALGWHLRLEWETICVMIEKGKRLRVRCIGSELRIVYGS